MARDDLSAVPAEELDRRRLELEGAFNRVLAERLDGREERMRRAREILQENLDILDEFVRRGAIPKELNLHPMDHQTGEFEVLRERWGQEPH